jgi:hypothetical protein
LVGFEERLCVVAPLLFGVIQMGPNDTRSITARMRLDDGKERSAHLEVTPSAGPGEEEAVSIRCQSGNNRLLAELHIDRDEAMQLASAICRAFDRREILRAVLKDREELIDLVDTAVKFLWHRVGRGGANNYWSNKWTAARTIDFIKRHGGPKGKLVQAVQHIYKENHGGKIRVFMGLGEAAALMYLMGASETDGKEYRKAETPGDAKIDFSRWDKAEEFWVELAKAANAREASPMSVLRSVCRPTKPGDSPRMPPRMKALPKNASEAEKEAAEQAEADALVNCVFASGNGRGVQSEREAYIVKAWEAFLDHGRVSLKDLDIPYVWRDDDDHSLGVMVSGDFASNLGGIDDLDAEETESGEEEEEGE